jgi:hypothetical protein
MMGESADVVQAYLDSVQIPAPEAPPPELPPEEPEPEEIPVPLGEALLPPPEQPGPVIISRVFITNDQEQPVTGVAFNQPFYVALEYTVKQPIHQLQLGFFLANGQETIVLVPVSNNGIPCTGSICEPGHHRIFAKIPAPLLVPGRYHIAGVGAYEEGIGHHHRVFEKILEFDVELTLDHEGEWFGPELVHPPIEWTLE